MTPPPEDLKQWPKRQLIREVERLRAITREHATRSHGDAPKDAGGFVDVAGDPYAKGGVIIDARGAVLLEHTDVVLIDSDPSKDREPGILLSLGGRINLTDERAQVGFLMPLDGGAAIASELIGLAGRAGPPVSDEFMELFRKRMDELP